MSELALSVRNVSKSYSIAQNAMETESTLTEVLIKRLKNPLKWPNQETFWALQDINFDVKKGEVLGIIGRNGAGKSTLLKVLSRITEPTTGEITLYGRVGSLLEVGTGFHPELTGRENIFLNGAILGMTRVEIKKQFDAIVDFAGVDKFLETPVKRYSSGMYVRLAFAVAANLRSDILIVDEVLAVGDTSFQEKCLGKMRDVAQSGRTVLFVSHSISAIRNLCTTGLLLARGNIQASGEVIPIVNAYLDNGSQNTLQIPNGPLRRVSVSQVDDAILIEAEWSHNEVLPVPNFGFVIHDSTGAPIVGVNPKLLGIERAGPVRSSGRVVVRLTEPRLLDGRYYLSAYFGDGTRDFVEMPKCLVFDVLAMAGPRQAPAIIVGPVAPRCKYDFGSL